MLKPFFTTAALVVCAALTGAAAGAQTADFGLPPSGKIPILFNDHHVYAKPDRMKNRRVIVAMAHGYSVYVPMRSMFEQMGASVLYDPVSKTIEVQKPGADIRMTVGVALISYNGESRPLDVPPIDENGVLYVPLRVLSEAMGAYVYWEPRLKIVVVRYLTSITPTPAPIATPSGGETPGPAVSTVPAGATAPPTRVQYPAVQSPWLRYIVVDNIIAPKTFDELSPGHHGSGLSFGARVAAEIPFGHVPLLLGGEFRQFDYPHYSDIPAGGFIGFPCQNASQPGPYAYAGDEGCVTLPNRSGQIPVPGFNAREKNLEAHLGIRVMKPRIYLEGSYLGISNNYPATYPLPSTNGFGFGLEKLPDLDRGFSIYGSIYDYPSVNGTIGGTTAILDQRWLMYRGGVAIGLGNLFLDAGYEGQNAKSKSNSPSDVSQAGPFVGLGLHF